MLRGNEVLDLELVDKLQRFVIQLDIVLENVGNRRLLENRLPGSFRFAGAAIDAFLGVDVEHVGEVLFVLPDVLVDAVDRADADASGVDAVNAKPGYRPWHNSSSLRTCPAYFFFRVWNFFCSLVCASGRHR
jgi:hypothetical protein